MTDALPAIPGYDVEAEIGRGGMGVVYRVRRRSSNSPLALKMILQSRGAAFAELARFRIEAEALACLNHPNIIKIRDVGVYAGYPYIAIDFAERGNLKQAISGNPQPPRWGADLVRTLALAMHHAHERGMLHRDLKPGNVLLMGDGTPVITDFGLVKFTNPFREVSKTWCTVDGMTFFLNEELNRYAKEFANQYNARSEPSALSNDLITRGAWEECAARTGVLGDESRLQSIQAFLSEAQEQSQREELNLDNLTQSGSVMGSPSYMAPEQARGDLRRIGPRTDVYALGIILYELLTGQPPFRRATVYDLLSQVCSAPPTPPAMIVPSLNFGIEAVCLKCMEKSPDNRYTTAFALADDLTKFLNGERPAAAGRKWWPFGRSAQAVAQQDDDCPTTRSWWPFGRRHAQSGESQG